jgi:hypothetical protein
LQIVPFVNRPGVEFVTKQPARSRRFLNPGRTEQEFRFVKRNRSAAMRIAVRSSIAGSHHMKARAGRRIARRIHPPVFVRDLGFLAPQELRFLRVRFMGLRDEMTGDACAFVRGFSSWPRCFRTAIRNSAAKFFPEFQAVR